MSSSSAFSLSICLCISFHITCNLSRISGFSNDINNDNYLITKGHEKDMSDENSNILTELY